ncbi:MAG: HPF/RaiA family ribosome-associated protein [Sphingobacteriales bacterium]|nr:MAG: HPF/RaiA family ribosome-associated protein [Sphingobacteriales bacterium]
MLVQLNANHLEGTNDLRTDLIDLITDSLSRFDEHITRVEVHLGDENGNKEGAADKRCTIEARLEGKDPVAVIHHADSYEIAVDGALDKIEGMLDKMLERQRNY